MANKKIILSVDDKKSIEGLINFKVDYKKRIIIDNVSYNVKDNVVSILIQAGKKYIAMTVTNNTSDYIITRGPSTRKLHKALKKGNAYKTIAAMTTLRCLCFNPLYIGSMCNSYQALYFGLSIS